MADNYTQLIKAETRKLISESASKYLTSKITLPLGNPVLKNVHTNSFLWTEFPNDFPLKNWDIIVEALNNNDAINTGYTKARWYIESVDISVDVSGKAEMSLGLNAFPSTFNKSYVKNYTSAIEEYTKTLENQNKNTTTSTTTTTNTNNTTNATTNTNTNYFPTKAGKNVGGNLKEAVKKMTKDCNTEEQRAYCIYDWVDRYVNYNFYWNSRYSSSQVLTGHKANCWDTAHLIYDLCNASKPKVRCEIWKGQYKFLDNTYGHVWNKLPYKGKMTFADTGRESRNPIGNHGNGRKILSQSLYKKNY